MWTSCSSTPRRCGSIRPDLPAGLSEAVGGRIPLLVSSDLAERFPDGDATLDDQQAVTVGSIPSSWLPDFTEHWVLVDSAFAEQAHRRRFRAGNLLVGVEPGVDPSTVSTAIREVVVEAQTEDEQAAVSGCSTRPHSSRDARAGAHDRRARARPGPRGARCAAAERADRRARVGDRRGIPQPHRRRDAHARDVAAPGQRPHPVGTRPGRAHRGHRRHRARPRAAVDRDDGARPAAVRRGYGGSRSHRRTASSSP